MAMYVMRGLSFGRIHPWTNFFEVKMSVGPIPGALDYTLNKSGSMQPSRCMCCCNSAIFLTSNTHTM